MPSPFALTMSAASSARRSCSAPAAPTLLPRNSRPSRTNTSSGFFERQKEIGLDIFTDGELRRTNFMSDFTDAVEGFDFGDAVARQWKDDDEKAQHSAAAGQQHQRHRHLDAEAAAAAYRPRASLPQRTRSRAHQDDAAQRHAVSRHLVQVRHHRRGLPRSLRIAQCHHRHHGRRHPHARRPAASPICRSMRRATATTSIPSGLRGWRTNCASIPRRC